MVRRAGWFRRAWFPRGAVAILAVAGLLGAQSLPPYQGSPQYPQQPAQSAPQQPQPLPTQSEDAQPLTQQQLEDLVAPIALYPDPLLGQVLAASTYPLEIVDAEQWLQQHRSMPAAQLVDAAKQQTWDPSVQALVAFPDVLDILGHDVRWTTDLGNAFLGQQADVMRAIQSLRVRAQQSGALQSTPQQAVSTQYQDGQSAVQIQPADPQVVYVPVYQPYAVWGPPAYGAYPSLWYPPTWGFGGGIGFSPGVFLSSLFTGLLNFGPWGWGLNWFSHALFWVPQFFAHFFTGWWGGHGYGYGFGGGALAGRQFWMHDPIHRMGVPYANRAVATRFGGHYAVGGHIEGARAEVNRGFGRAEGARVEAGRAGQSFRSEASRNEAPRAQAGGAFRGASGAERSYGTERSYGGNSFAGNSFAGRAAPQGNGFRSEPQARSFSQPQARSYSQPQARSFSQPQARSFSQPQARSFNESRSFSQPRPSQNMSRSFSQSRAPSQQHFSAPHSSAPHVSSSHGGGNSHGSSSHGGGGGHSSGGHSGGSHHH